MAPVYWLAIGAAVAFPATRVVAELQSVTADAEDAFFPSPFVAVQGTCANAPDHCTIQTIEDCEYAAQRIGNDDTKANHRSSFDLVAGCSINNKGGLRFNEQFDSTFIHNTGDQDTAVLCGPCLTTTPKLNVPTLPASSDYMFSDTICECSGRTTITDAATCELAAAELFHEDTTANAVNTLSVPRGCSVTARGVLRFNQDLNSPDLNEGKSEMKRTICSTEEFSGTLRECGVLYVLEDTGNCDAAPGYCPIQSAADCLIGAAYVDLDEHTVTEEALTSNIGGCLVSAADGLVFNTNFGDGSIGNRHSAVCTLCDATTAPPAAGVAASQYSVADEADGFLCDGVTNCAITSLEDCEDAVGTTLGDLHVVEIQSTSKPTGCVVSSSEVATFNHDVESTSTAGLSADTPSLCAPCALQTEDADRAGELVEKVQDRDDFGGLKWWGILAATAATVVVVVVAVIVVMITKKARKSVVPATVDGPDRNLVSPSNASPSNTASPSNVNLGADVSVVEEGSMTL